METNCAIYWIVISPVDSVIHLLNKWGQNEITVHTAWSWEFNKKQEKAGTQYNVDAALPAHLLVSLSSLR